LLVVGKKPLLQGELLKPDPIFPAGLNLLVLKGFND
jgi:hypothetical protein